jgi:hypothetical protein
LNLATRGEHSHKFSTKQLRVWWHRAKNERIHDMPKPLLSGVERPSDPIIPWSETENRVTETKETNEFAIIFIVDDESKAAPVSRRDWNAPMEPSVPEQQLIFRIRLDLDEAWPDTFRSYLAPPRQMREESIFVTGKSTLSTFDVVPHRFCVDSSKSRLIHAA